VALAGSACGSVRSAGGSVRSAGGSSRKRRWVSSLSLRHRRGSAGEFRGLSGGRFPRPQAGPFPNSLRSFWENPAPISRQSQQRHRWTAALSPDHQTLRHEREQGRPAGLISPGLSDSWSEPWQLVFSAEREMNSVRAKNPRYSVTAKMRTSKLCMMWWPLVNWKEQKLMTQQAEN
jgi:hypothetical protein